jgi:hypothetical protein
MGCQNYSAAADTLRFPAPLDLAEAAQAQQFGNLSGTAIEAPGRALSEQDLRTILEAPHRFVPTSTGGRLADLIDHDAVALTVARTVLTQT